MCLIFACFDALFFPPFGSSFVLVGIPPAVFISSVCKFLTSDIQTGETVVS